MRCASHDWQRWQQPSQGGLHTGPPPLLLAWMHSRVYQAAANLQFRCALVFTCQAGLTCTAVGSNSHKVGSKMDSHCQDVGNTGQDAAQRAAG